MKLVEFKDYCGKLVLKSRMYLGIIFLLLVSLIYVSAKPKVYPVPGSKILLFAFYKYNYTPEDYPKTFLKWELQSPLVNKQKLIEQVRENRLYSYYRPKKAFRRQDGSWVVVGKREVFTDKPTFQVLKKGRFTIVVKNVAGKLYVDEEEWR